MPAAAPSLLLLDPVQARQLARRRTMAVLLPLLGVALVVAAIIGIAVFADRANRSGVLTLADDLLLAIERRVVQEVAAYLDPPARAVRLAVEFTEEGSRAPTRSRALERFGSSVLREIPQASLFSVGDPQGHYMQVRGNSLGGQDIKRIDNTPGARRITVQRRNAEGEVVFEGEDPLESFDPRTRPWYRGAAESQALHWTEPYIFFSDRVPGLTVSMPVRDETSGQVTAVIGVDVRLDALSRFLANLRIGGHGQALILDSQGRLVAWRDPDRVMREDGDRLVAMQPDELGDAVITRAFDMVRLEPELRRNFDLDGRRYIVVASPLPATGTSGWKLLLVAPEADFTGFVAANNRTALLMSGGVVAMTLLLAGFLVRQGLRADRAVRAMLQQGQSLAAQSAAFARLGGSAALFETGAEMPPALTEELAGVTGARRTSLWRLAGDQLLHCEDAFEAETRGHIRGAELVAEELPALFAAITHGEVLVVPDAARDPRTAELHRLWLHPLGSQALVSVPIMARGALVGLVWVEDAAAEAEGVADFARAVANLAALRLAAAGASAGAVTRMPLPAVSTGAAPQPLGSVALGDEETLADEHAAEVYAGVAVMALRFTDTMALDRWADAETANRMDRAARGLQGIAAAHRIPYLKLLGDQILAAAGHDGDKEAEPLLRLAQAALEARQHCAALFEALGGQLEFRIGLDFGVAIGTAVGAGHRVFNLWGDAVRNADAMAASALPGTVQVTEAAYERLRPAFLLRPRGSFWVPRLGERRTYVLASRL